MNFKDYIIYMFIENTVEFPSIKFWGLTLMMVNIGMEIKMPNGHFLTVHDCFNEANDLINGIEYEGDWVRAWWEQYQYLRNLIKKPKWIE